jgi:hypothetical protein
VLPRSAAPATTRCTACDPCAVLSGQARASSITRAKPNVGRSATWDSVESVAGHSCRVAWRDPCRKGGDALLFRRVQPTLHRMCLARACLPIRKYGAVVPLHYVVHDGCRRLLIKVGLQRAARTLPAPPQSTRTPRSRRRRERAPKRTLRASARPAPCRAMNTRLSTHQTSSMEANAPCSNSIFQRGRTYFQSYTRSNVYVLGGS